MSISKIVMQNLGYSPAEIRERLKLTDDDLFYEKTDKERNYCINMNQEDAMIQKNKQEVSNYLKTPEGIQFLNRTFHKRNPILSKSYALIHYSEFKKIFIDTYQSINHKREHTTVYSQRLITALKTVVDWAFGAEVQNGIKYSKGFLFFGPPGTGKTTIIQTLANLHHHTNLPPIRIYTTFDITSYYKKHENIDPFLKGIICIDDFGITTEKQDTVKSWGNEKNPVYEVLFQRHRLNLITHVTTNLTDLELSGRIDDRLISRFYEMFNMIEISGTDFRKL